MIGSGEEVNEQPDTRNKRFKTAAASDLAANGECVKVLPTLSNFYDVLSSEFQTTLQESLEFCKNSYTNIKPFPYGCIPSIFQIGFVQKVIQEIKDHSVVNFKESDLFKVFQSIDLANLQTDDVTTVTNMPSVMKLRSFLYSVEFRHFIEDMNGLPRNTLSDKIDCACNCHMTGCHLLCHDDVIGTRKVSYILYLTENDPVWAATEGGALELYDSVVVDETSDNTSEKHLKQAQRRIPTTVPCKFILPICNNLAFFVVDPGYSFHAVQEVFGDRPRLSLQGWYHASVEPKNMEFATLQRLKSYHNPQVVQEEDTEGPFSSAIYPSTNAEAVTEGSSENDILSESDLLFLQKYISAPYLTTDGISEIRLKFEKNSSVELRCFLREDWERQLASATSDADCISPGNQGGSSIEQIDPTSLDYYEVGVSDNWITVGPAHKQRFLEYRPAIGNSSSTSNAEETKLTAADRVGEILYQDIRCQLLQSPVFGRYLAQISSLGLPTAFRGRVRRFRPGRDYTVAHYGLLTQRSVLDATLCFVNANPTQLNETDELWQSGDCGGFECYIAAEDEDDPESAADEYNADDDTELLSVSAGNNTLSLVFRDPGTMRFVKYLGSKAPSSRWDIAMEYEVPDSEDDDGGADDDDDEAFDKECSEE